MGARIRAVLCGVVLVLVVAFGVTPLAAQQPRQQTADSTTLLQSEQQLRQGDAGSFNYHEFSIQTFKLCETVREDDSGREVCVGESEVFPKSNPDFSSYLLLTNVTEEITVRTVWQYGEYRYESNQTVSPTERITISQRAEFSQQNPPEEVRLTVYIDGNRRLLERAELSARPIARFNRTSALVNRSVAFDGSESIDPDGTVQTYAWDFTGDGRADRHGPRVNWTFTEGAVDRDVALTVVGSQGLESTTERTVHVNEPPKAGFVFDRDIVYNGTPARVVASNSTDADGPIEHFRWDVDGDGRVETTGPETTVIPDGETLTVSLTVTDSYGVNDTITRAIPVWLDTDNDGLADRFERTNGTDPTVADTDGDGLDDGREVPELPTDPTVADTDGDGLDDGREVLDLPTDPTVADTDGDGLDDGREVLDLPTDPMVADTDGDGLDDGREVLDLGTDPTNTDTDEDGVSDSREVEVGTDPTNADTDGDGLNDLRELNGATDPTVADTDDDGFNDSLELQADTNPTLNDTDGDSLEDGYEYNRTGLDPLQSDSDGDLFDDPVDPVPGGSWFPLGGIHFVVAVGAYLVGFRLL